MVVCFQVDSASTANGSIIYNFKHVNIDFVGRQLAVLLSSGVASEPRPVRMLPRSAASQLYTVI